MTTVLLLPLILPMPLPKQDKKVCKEIAHQEGVSAIEVSKAIQSFFDSIVSAARKLPFDKETRIYSPAAFKQYPLCFNLPYLGRIGPLYSQYLRWRSSEAKGQESVARSQIKKVHTKPLIEEAAKQALAGNKVDPSFLKKRLPSGKYSTVWLVGENNKKKAAKQIIINK